MEINQLASSVVTANKPADAEQLYNQMTATSVDFRTLGVPDDWLDELWDLSLDVRKRLKGGMPLPEGESGRLMTAATPKLKRMGVTMKSPARVSRESQQRAAEIEDLFKRLQLIRQNAWFDIKIDAFDAAVYQSEREVMFQVLAYRLSALETLRPKPSESAQTAHGYLETINHWDNLDRPSTLEERRKSMDVMVQLRLLLSRTKQYYDERNRVIFLWVDPITEWDPNEAKAIRAEMIREMEEKTGESINL